MILKLTKAPNFQQTTYKKTLTISKNTRSDERIDEKLSVTKYH